MKVGLSVCVLGSVVVSVGVSGAVGSCFVVRFNIVCGAILHGLWCGLRMLVEGYRKVGFEACGVVAGEVNYLLILVFFEEFVECGLCGFFSAAE